MLLNKNNLEVILSNNDFFTGGETLRGTVSLEINDPQGFEVDIIKVRLICAVDVRISKKDQVTKEKRQSVSTRSKLYDEEIVLTPEIKFLEFGIHEFNFSFDLPSESPTFPPTCFHRISGNTKAFISHYIKATVKRVDSSFFRKREFSKNAYFTFVPMSIVPTTIEQEELGFVTQVSPYGGGKVIGKMSELSSNMSYYTREVEEFLPSGTNSLGKLIKTTTGLGPTKQPDVSLICKVILPSKRIRQDLPVDFTISLTTASSEQNVMLKSLKVRINTILVLTVDNKSIEKVVDTTSVFQKSMIQSGNYISVNGDLIINKTLLPTFYTPNMSYFHNLEFIFEVSHTAQGQVYEATQLIEYIPAALFSYFSKSHEEVYQSEKWDGALFHPKEPCLSIGAFSEELYCSPDSKYDSRAYTFESPPHYES